MTTEPLYCFEYPPADILVRAIGFSSELQIIQHGKPVAEYSMHCNSPVGFAPNGLVLYDTGYSYSHLLDLNRPFPQPGRSHQGGALLHPDGRHSLGCFVSGYPYTDPTTQRNHTGLVLIDLKTSAAETLWDGDTAHARFTLLFDQTPETAKSDRSRMDDSPDDPIKFPDFFIAPDGVTWALARTDRLVVGRGDQLLSNVYWNRLSFYRPKITFDAARARVLLSGGPGIVAFTLTGEIAAQWSAGAGNDGFPVVSPATLWRDDLLAVVRAKYLGYGKPQGYEVWRFDPDTLALRGRLAEMPRRRDADEEFGLLPLADGSLAWVAYNQPIIILPAPGTAWRSTDALRVIGDEPPPVVPVPKADWYDPVIGSTGDGPPPAEMTPGQRRSLARYLLNEQVEDAMFETLLRLDAAAFTPYADQVLKWNNEKLRRLRQMDFRNFRLVARGASDAAVDALAATLRKRLPSVHRERVELLIGADTARALGHLGELARLSGDIAELCTDYHLEIPAAGPAIRRFTPEALDINAYRVDKDDEIAHTPGLAYPLPAADFLPENRGWMCRAPVAHILSARLDLLPGNPLAASPLKVQHWFMSGGEECCDESTVGHSLAYRVLPDSLRSPQVGSEHLVELIANLSYPRQDREEGCDYESDEEPEPQKNDYRLVLEPFCGARLDWPHRHLGRLGGYPDWWQQPEVPTCPECGRMMFYVGEVTSDAIRGDVISAGLFAFHCENCGVGVQIVQIT